ncbi:3-hydroxyacyl-CoA dehydrogenase NAD-binding domain-containing protein [Streptomyces sp. LHD-70]|uniref:3-hydroxyacyl-CoA dehydrogenase NAD-binding domain-containing protein n=1 Tax=Streptomyces sp. LHD-70 TaxID=3072140 RepID=UPI002810674C|nr:3-hydroxyacyl-CoA dehydrogenase NAD-binding domain-containing protein [Streptomyces sp. LHD-70]MDQ8704094.1 3-hydroxyacyl-CoA dehydrogenase NAD-binding domain-containing protein [Streptomyces sp. LHD-70]
MSHSEPKATAASDVTRVASLGGGVIGQSWTALFLAAGTSVTVFDPDPRAEQRVRQAVDTAWPVLTQLGLTAHGDPGALHFTKDARTAVEGAQFVQESVPEQLGVKHELYAAIEPALDDGTVVASSASGLTLTEMQGGWHDPGRFVLGHPFNPPHLIPLVEVMGNERTASGTVERARTFYEAIGKVTIEVRREVPGHVANRLQAALWREAIHLVNEGVASVEDVDTAVAAGPGLRWAAMGPTMLFHLGAGDGGLAAFCERYADSFNRWFDSLGRPHLDGPTAERLVEGLRPISEKLSVDNLAQQRDALITSMIALARSSRKSPPNAR